MLNSRDAVWYDLRQCPRTDSPGSHRAADPTTRELLPDRFLEGQFGIPNTVTTPINMVKRSRLLTADVQGVVAQLRTSSRRGKSSVLALTQCAL